MFSPFNKGEWNRIARKETKPLFRSAKSIHLLALAALCCICLNATPASAQFWMNSTIGGPERDYAEEVIQTSDGGHAVVGSTRSFGAGGYDIMLTRLDQNGVELWTRVYGDVNDQYGYDVEEIDRDGDGNLDGFAIVGNTKSGPNNTSDIYLVITNTSGLAVETRTFGGPRNEYGYSVTQTADYGYLIAGRTGSYGRPYANVTSVIVGNMFVVRTDNNLELEWSTVISSDELSADYAFSAIETLSGDIMVAGKLGEYGYGGKDAVVVQLDNNGAVNWSRFIGHVGSDEAHEIREVVNGGVSDGFIVVGTIRDLGAGGDDAFLLRLDVNGNVTWNKVYGGASTDKGYSVAFTNGGGFVLCGMTRSFNNGSTDMYAVEVDANGTMLQSFTFGTTTDTEEGRSVRRRANGTYVLAGFAYGFGAGSQDFWVFETDVNLNAICHQELVVSEEHDNNKSQTSSVNWATIHMACTGELPINSVVNPSLEAQCQFCGCTPGTGGFQHAFGAAGTDIANNVTINAFDQLIVTGVSNSYNVTGDNDMYLIKTDPAGNLLWSRVYEPSLPTHSTNEEGVAVIEMPSGGYFVAGTTNDGFDSQVYVVVTDPSGAPTLSWNFNPILGTSDAKAVDAQPILNRSGNITGYMVLAELWGYNVNRDPYLLEFDVSGNFVSGAVLDQTSLNSLEVYSLSPTDDDGDGVQDDGWVIAGLVNDAGNFGSVVIKTDIAGNPQWQNVYQYSDPTYYGFGFDIIQINSDGDGQQDDGYALAGITFHGSSTDAFIMRIDPAGNPEPGLSAIYTSTLNVEEEGVAIQQTCANDLVVTGRHNNKAWSLRTDVALNVQCASDYGANGNGNELITNRFGGAVIVGQEFNPQTATIDAYLVVTDCECYVGCNEESLSMTRTNKDMAPMPFAIVRVDENRSKIISSVNVLAPGEFDLCGAGLVDPGSVGTSDGTEMPEAPEVMQSTQASRLKQSLVKSSSNSEFALFPNPILSGNDLNVQFNSADARAVHVSVLDVLGQTVLEQTAKATVGEQSIKLSTEGWPAGSYTVSLRAADSELQSSIVVVIQ